MTRRAFLLHLRLPFNYILAPLFVWGAVVADGRLGARFWLGFAAFHVFLYGGTNMFNSWYDRDRGPIGGLAHPPAAERGMLAAALTLKGVGLLLALPLGPPFAAAAAAFTLYSFAYSHPAVRLKRSPFASALSVFLGQGVVGFAAGFLAAGGPPATLTARETLVGALAGALLVSALYPLTQIYQLEEDARRGDRSLALRLGSPAVFLYSATLLLAGAWAAAWLLAVRGVTAPALGVVAMVPAGAMALVHLARRLGRQGPSRLYRSAIAFLYAASTLLLAIELAVLATRAV